jgi:hypothetical protein
MSSKTTATAGTLIRVGQRVRGSVPALEDCPTQYKIIRVAKRPIRMVPRRAIVAKGPFARRPDFEESSP